MKFYNPFKPHIVHHPEHGYAVRKHCLLGWEYLDEDGKYWWWGMNYALRWAMMDSLEKAYKRLELYYTPKPKWEVVT